MGNYFEALEEAFDEAEAIRQADNPTNVVRLNAILEACLDGRRKGFKLAGSGAPEDIPLNDGTGRTLTVRVLKYPETTVAGMVAVETHGDGTESGRLLAVGRYSNGQQLADIYDRGMQRLGEWVSLHATLAHTGDST